jgi:hypothetical protein
MEDDVEAQLMTSLLEQRAALEELRAAVDTCDPDGEEHRELVEMRYKQPSTFSP